MDNYFEEIKETSLNTHEIFVRIFDKIMKKIIASKFTEIKNKKEIDFIYQEIYNILKGFDIKDKINYLLEFYNNKNKNDILTFLKTENGPKRGFREDNIIIKKELIALINGYNNAVMNNDNIEEIEQAEKELKKKFSRTGSLGFRFTTNIYSEIDGINRLSKFLDVRRKIDGTYLLNNKVIDKETILSYFPFTGKLTTNDIG